jgi:dTDP-4-amino-4,6-dideoxygalactose transaminase
MEALQGSILRVKLRHLDEWTDMRRSNAAIYNRLLANCGEIAPSEMRYARHVYHVYTLRTERRDALQQALSERGIHTGIHYPIPVHLQPAYADLGYRLGDFPCAEKAAREVLSLPMYAGLTETQLETVCSAVNEYFQA